MTPEAEMSKTDTARRLSDLARTLYAEHGCPGAYVTLTDSGEYELHEPSPNAFPIRYTTAKECEAAIRMSAAQLAADDPEIC